MPPGATAYRQGNLWYYKYPDQKLHHWDMGKVLKPFVEATLVPYWSGALGGSGSRPVWFEALAALGAAAATVWVIARVRGRRAGQASGAGDRGGSNALG